MPGSQPMICIVPAAGASSRMERRGKWAHKLLLPWPPGPPEPPGPPARTIVQASVQSALDSGCEVILVVGHEGARVAALFSGEARVRVVRNEAWERGMLGSIQRGIDALPPASATRDRSAVFIHHADMPSASSDTFSTLLAAAASRAAAGLPDAPLFAGWRGSPGHPVLVPARLLPAILALDPGAPLKPFLLAQGGVVVETGCPGVLRDIDTPVDYEAAGIT